jgi:glycosyltransferase involved in cell wall biosynthesis
MNPLDRPIIKQNALLLKALASGQGCPWILSRINGFLSILGRSCDSLMTDFIFHKNIISYGASFD